MISAILYPQPAIHHGGLVRGAFDQSWGYAHYFFPNKATACIYLAIVIIVGFGIRDKSCSKVFIMTTMSGSSVMWTGRVVVIPAE